MEYRPLEVTLISAKDLKDVNKFTKMDVYAVVSINGDPRTSQKTPVDKDCGSKPKWNHNLKFTIDESAAQLNALTLVIKLISDRTMGDKEVGEVHVPLKELLEQSKSKSDEDDKEPRDVTYDVRLPNGKPKGFLNLSYNFREKFYPAAVPPPVAAVQKKLDGCDPVTAYPPAGYPAGPSGYPAGPSGYTGYAPPPPAGAYLPQYYPPPPQHGYGGYPYHQPPHGGAPPPGYGGYGYPSQGGYGYPPGVQQPMKTKKNKMGGGLGLGLGAGLLGGLLVGDMIGDVGEAAAYDEGYMDGMDDF